MPMFIDIVPVDLYKLLEDCRLASGTFDSEARRIVKMTVDLSSMFIV